MRRAREISGRESVPRIGLPLLGSAMGHAVLLWALLTAGGATGPPGREAVQVLLVEGTAFARSGAGEAVRAPAGGGGRSAAVRALPTTAPRRRPISVAPPPVAPVVRASPSPRVAVPPAPWEEEPVTPQHAQPAADTLGPVPPPRQASVPKPQARSPLVSAARSDEAGNAGDRVAAGASSGAAADQWESEAGALARARRALPRDGPTGNAGPREAPFPEGGGHGPPAAGGGAGGDGLPGRLALLRARIQEKILYPPEAVRRGAEGEVLLRIRIGTGGIPREIRVARSSGTRILDEAARRGVVRAAPLPSDPGWFEIPVRFSLR